MPRPKQRTPALRDRVLQAAASLLADEGVAAFTTRNVARHAETSVPAIYELFGDRGGLLREVFFEGFRLLAARFDELAVTDDPPADLRNLIAMFRSFVQANPVLADIMFSRPFADFDPGPSELDAGRAAREHIIGRVRRAVEAGVLVGNETDVAHVILGLAQGLARQETAGWLGTSRASVNRRWALAVDAMLAGLAPT